MTSSRPAPEAELPAPGSRLSFYNSLTRRLEPFHPLVTGRVTMYNCGPTVYSHPHIGNFRSFIFADVLRRWLEYRGYAVTQAMNITDVGHLTRDDVEAGEDKLEAAARKEKKDPWKIAEHYMNEFFALRDLLNLRPAHHYPRATDHIAEQIDLARRLIEKDYAYVVGGNVYFAVEKFATYGRLSGNTLDQLKAGARIEINAEKRNPMDFALWKQDPQHLMQWESPWGRGFPGWHLECSAMAMKYLGETLDIHTGGEDNIFPHHESEIAQSEGANGKPFARYWLHARHLLVDGRKMSKSSGNFYTVKDILDRGFSPRVLRYALMSAHYRQSYNFTFEGLEAARSAVARLADFHRRLNAGGGDPSPEMEALCRNASTRFESAMDDDLNISEGLAALFDFVRDANKLLDGAGGGTSAALAQLMRFDAILGILEMAKKESIDAEVERLIAERNAARAAKDFARSDAIRAQLKAMGVILEDGKGGTTWKRAGTFA